MAKKKTPKVTLQKVIGENEWIVWAGGGWAGTIRPVGKKWKAGRKLFATRKEAVSWCVRK